MIPPTASPQWSAFAAARRTASGSSVVPLKNAFSATAEKVASRIPDSMRGWISAGIHWLKSGATSGIMPMPSEIATTSRLLRLAAKSTPDRMRMPVAATMPNMAIPAPPRTETGSAGRPR